MNLSEALDAALPEIPKAKLARTRPPCLDPELIAREDTLDGEPVIGVFQRRQGNFFRLEPIQWQLAVLFDGERTYDEIAELFKEQTGAETSAEEIRMFAKNMDEADFWYQSPQERNIALNEKLTAQRSRRAQRTSKINIAHISFNGWDPDRYLTLLDRAAGGFIYSTWSVWAAVALFLFEAVIFISKWHVIGPDIPLFYNFGRKSLVDLAVFWILFLVIGFFHESAHGLTCKHYGGEVHKMGLMLIYLTPAFFVDVTESWISGTRVQRLATIIAGIWVEMIFCGIAMIVWTNTQSGQWLHDFSYEIILITGLAVIVVNLNPLIKLDGYYFLTEFMGVPDLKERSTSFLTGWFQSRVLGLPVEVPVIARRRVPFFVLYAIVSGAYSYMLLFFVIRFCYNITSNWLAEFALIPAGALAFTVFRSRLRSLRDVLERFWKKHFVDGVRLRPVPVLSLAALLLLVFVPILRDHETAYFVIEASRTETLHAASAGQVEDVLVKEGDRVRAGQALLQMRSAAVASMRSSAVAQVDAARYETFRAELHGSQNGHGEVQRRAAEAAVRLAGTAEALLQVRAPADGVVLTEDPQEMLHRDVSSGAELLTVAEDGPRVVRVFVPVVGLARIEQNAQVSLVLPGTFETIRLRLGALEGDAVTLPNGLVAAQDYKGITLPTFYYARMQMPESAAGVPLGVSGEARIFGRRRSLFQHGFAMVEDLVRSHLW
jgi:putative peptide zinc metalloprotease protein